MSTGKTKKGMEWFGIDVRINCGNKTSSSMIFSEFMEDAP